MSDQQQMLDALKLKKFYENPPRFIRDGKHHKVMPSKKLIEMANKILPKDSQILVASYD